MPEILDGKNPVIVVILASLLIIPVNYYIAHGFNYKSTYAVVSTLITLIITGFLSTFFVSFSKLSGFASDEARDLVNQTFGGVNIQNILLASIIIGLLGILDDITISQASIAEQLKLTNKKIEFKELYFRTLEVGKDHIASLVNTLILVYTSASLPLLLLVYKNYDGFINTINDEMLAEEIVQMLLASISLILAVPISTFISCYFIDRKDWYSKNKNLDNEHFHSH
ncbi:MAG: YibE/F family protein [Candidatus Dojkabacteria bacterium]|nr:YibE/F family protein [Candidatus Dojkabacteria bacterium]